MNKGTLETEQQKRPGYKWTKLGWVPEEWEVGMLGKIAKIATGGTPNKIERFL